MIESQPNNNLDKMEAAKSKELFPKDFFTLQTQFATEISKNRDITLNESLLRYTSAHARLFNHPAKGVDDKWSRFVAELPNDSDKIAEYIYDAYVSKEQAANQEIDVGKVTYGCFSHVYKEANNTFVLHFGNNDPEGNLSKDRVEARLQNLRDLTSSIESYHWDGAEIQMTSWLLSIDAFNRLLPEKFIQNIKNVTQDVAQDNGLWGQFLDKNGEVKSELAEQLLENARDENLSVIDCFPLRLRTAKTPQEVFFDQYL